MGKDIMPKFEPLSPSSTTTTPRSTPSSGSSATLHEASGAGPSILPFFPPVTEPWRLNKCCNLAKDDTTLDHIGECQDFNIEALTWAISNDLSSSCIERYLNRWPNSRTKSELCRPLKGERGLKYPILFFAVERNCPEIIRILCRAGADPSQTVISLRLPVLAYCIFSAEYELSDTTDSLFALLPMGADPLDVPRDMWCDYIKAPQKIAPLSPQGESTASILKYSWCTAEVRAALCRTFNLLQRYQFKMASLLPRNTARHKQVAEAFKLTPLFEVPFQIIGQRLAAKTVQEWLMSHALHHVDMPLVLLFTGPSGHGKTELAKRMGELLSLPMVKIDCTHLRLETDLFGAQAPYQGTRRPKAVVLLDEFDKMDHGVYKSMLLLFDEGFYTDRRAKGKILDCTKIIWVLASNQGEGLIQKFWDDHLAGKSEHLQLTLPITSLQQDLERSFKTTLGAPLTGRLSAIIPFMPFSEEERAVTTYKFMHKMSHQTRKPIDVDGKHLARHLFLNFIDDGTLASRIAEKYYVAELGARSLLKGVNTQILHELTSAFLEHGGKIADETNDKPLECYDVRVEELKGGFKDVTVKANGTRSVQKRPEREVEMDPEPARFSTLRPSTPPSKGNPKEKPRKRADADDLANIVNKKMRIR